MPYVWGGAGPDVFDCSGLVQWSMRQAGIVMPRVAVDQAQTGPLDPALRACSPATCSSTTPTRRRRVTSRTWPSTSATGLMLQAPEPGVDVQIVPAIFGGGFAGAVQVYPRIAAAVAADPAG